MKNYDTEIFYENYWTTVFEVYKVVSRKEIELKTPDIVC